MRPTVIIAEDDYILLEGALRPIVSSEFEVVAAVSDGLDAIEVAEKYRPSIVLMDVSLPKVRGFEAARRILAAQPECKVLFVSNYWDTVYIEAAREMGAAGYVFKSRAQIELIPALRNALKGEFYSSRP